MSQTTQYAHGGIISGVPLPAGAIMVGDWQARGPEMPYRVIFGANRGVTDHRAQVSAGAIQFADGRIDDGQIATPSISVSHADPLTSDQARELAALLLEAADELDEWGDYAERPVGTNSP